VLSEDYSMLHMMSGPHDPDDLWRLEPDAQRWSRRSAGGLCHCRHAARTARDAYAEALAEADCDSGAGFRKRFDEIIASIQNPDDYAVWMVPVISGRKATG